MKKRLKTNTKKLLALTLSLAMLLPAVSVVTAETVEADPAGQADDLICEVAELSLEEANIEETEDEIAKNKDAFNEWDMGKKLQAYLLAKYPNLDANNNGTLDSSEWGANPYQTIEIKGSDYPGITKNMVQLFNLGALANVTSLTIDGIDEIRNISLPSGLKNLTIKNATLDLYESAQIMGNYEGSLAQANLETLILDNVTIGDRYENHTSGDETYPYETKIKLNIQNCASLKELKINVGFKSDAYSLAVNAGETSTFDQLTKAKCEITNTSQKGRIIIASKNPASFFAKNYPNVEEVNFQDNYFRSFLIENTDTDSNNDGFITQEELNKVTDLEISLATVGSRYIVVMHDFTDLKYFNNLERLKIELGGKGGGAFIRTIAFPNTGKLKKLVIQNTSTKYASMEIPSIESFEYVGNEGNTGEGGSNNPQITIRDTSGKLSSVIMENTDVSKLILDNQSAQQKSLKLDVFNCSVLSDIEFQNAGYKLVGNARVEDCGNLRHIGKNTSDGIWQIDGRVDDGKNTATLNLSNCKELASDCSEIIINYDFTGEQSLVMSAYSLNRLSDTHKLTINKNDNGGTGTIRIYCGSGDYLANKYKNSTGFDVQTGLSEPNVALFPYGNKLRRSEGEGATAYKRWVDTYDIVLRVPDTINNFSKYLLFYVAEAGTIRKISYESSVFLEIEKPEIAEWNSTNDTLLSKRQGETKIKVYLDEDKTKCIGEVNLYVRSIATDIELVNNNTQLGTGTQENPIVVAKNKGQVSVSATIKYDGDFLPSAHDDVYWMFAKLDSDGYKEMIPSEATSSGISVVQGSDQWVGRTNTRAFQFSGVVKEYKLIALVPVNKRNNAPNGDLIRKEFYIKVVDAINDTASPADSSEDSPVNPEPVVPGNKEDETGKYLLPDAEKKEVIYEAPKDATQKNVTIPDEIVVGGEVYKIIKVSDDAFKNNKSITNVEIGKNIETIGEGAFSGASNLKEVTLGESVKEIGENAFENCTSLQKITIPASTTEIGEGAFRGCKSLKTVALGKSVEEIGDSAFKNCSSLKAITVPAKTKTIGEGAFLGCKSLTSVKIGKAVNKIGDNAFKNCSTLKTIALPAAVKKLGDNAFNGCKKLSTLKITSTKLTSKTVDAKAFRGISSKTTIKVPKNMVKAYTKLFQQKGLSKKVSIVKY